MTDIKKLKSTKYLIILTIPIFIEYFLQLLVGYSDQFMISKYSKSGVSAIGNANTILNVFFYTLTVLSTSSIILITQYKGASLREKEKGVYSVSFYFNLLVGIIISLIFIVFPGFILELLRIPSESLNEGIIYLRIVGGGFFLTTTMISFSAFLKSNSMMKSTMIINVIANIINITGNLILIPKLGVTGAAISSVSSRIVACILFSIVFFYRVRVKLSIKAIMENKELFKKMLWLGIPAAGESFSYNFSQIIIQAIVNGFGLSIANTKFYASMFASVTYMSANSFSNSMQVIEGELLGMNKKEEAKRIVNKVLLISVITLTTIASIFYLSSDLLYGIFTNDQEVLKLGKTILLIDIFLEFGRAFNIVFVKCLQTAGDVIFPTVLSIIFCWSVAVLVSYILAVKLSLGLIGIWIAMMIDEIIRAIIFMIRYKMGKWLKINLV